MKISKYTRAFDGVKQFELCQVPDDLNKTEILLDCCYAFELCDPIRNKPKKFSSMDKCPTPPTALLGVVRLVAYQLLELGRGDKKIIIEAQ